MLMIIPTIGDGWSKRPIQQMCVMYTSFAGSKVNLWFDLAQLRQFFSLFMEEYRLVRMCEFLVNAQCMGFYGAFGWR